jgi:4,5-DOPA dioxygenase extradiol
LYGNFAHFDDAVTQEMATAPGDILRVCDHRDYENAVPTPDHFIPLLYLAGIAASANLQAETLRRGYTMGASSKSKTPPEDLGWGFGE